MIQHTILSLVLTLTILSCVNSDTSSQKTQINTSGATEEEMNRDKRMVQEGYEMEKKMEAYKKLTPLTSDELKATLPDEIQGFKQTGFTCKLVMNYISAEAEYKKDEKTSIKIALFDCAGETGSSLYILERDRMNRLEQSTEGSARITLINDVKAIEDWDHLRNEPSLTYLAGTRLLVKITGYNITPADLKALAEKIKFKIQ